MYADATSCDQGRNPSPLVFFHRDGNREFEMVEYLNLSRLQSGR